MKCKVINSTKPFLEKDVNEWLKTGKYEILNIVQTEHSTFGYITLTLFYYDEQEIRNKKLEKISKNQNENTS